MRALDGEQKLSQWPREIYNYIKVNPKKEILVGQSVRSEHEVMAVRATDRRVFISYNSKLACFVAWNMKACLGDACGADMVKLKLFAHSQRVYAANPKMTAVYQPVSEPGKPLRYQKICVFPVTNFMDFYDNYKTYMTPAPFDLGFQSPACEF